MSFIITCDNCGRESKIDLEKHYERWSTVEDIRVEGSIKLSFHEIYGLSYVGCNCGKSLQRTEYAR